MEQLLAEIERRVRDGQMVAAQHLLTTINTAQVPRAYRRPLAQLSRRAGVIAIGLKLLTPLVLAEKHGLNEEPTPEELAEYAILLQRNGSIKEAVGHLARIDAGSVPDAHLYRSFCHFSRWEYELAIPVLRLYIDAKHDEYARLVGRVNLAAALAMTRHHDEALLEIAAALPHAPGRIRANLLELRAQVAIQSDRPADAERDLEDAARLLADAPTHDGLFILKWRAVLAATRTRSPLALHEFRDQAMKRGRWESAREADLQALRVHFDHPRFEHLLFGSPYPAFRSRVQRELGVTSLLRETIHGDREGACFDVATGRLAGRELTKPGSKAHQLVEILLRDFYRPANMGGLFAELFPGEYFDIFSSPDRVHQILRRTRRWLREASLPARILENGGNYRLETMPGLGFRVPLRRQSADWYAIHLASLQERFSAGAKISAARLREVLGFTEAEYKRFVKWALEEKRLARVGGGRSTGYRRIA